MLSMDRRRRLTARCAGSTMRSAGGTGVVLLDCSTARLAKEDPMDQRGAALAVFERGRCRAGLRCGRTQHDPDSEDLADMTFGAGGSRTTTICQVRPAGSD